MTRSIAFTQYLLPDGRKAAVSIDRPEDIAALADEVIKRGSRFECEMLRNGVCSFTVTHPDNDEPDIAIRLSDNGPNVPDVVDALVKDAAKWHNLLDVS